MNIISTPVKEGWNYRYYKTLFECEPTPERVKQICMNYMEGLEWTFKYYRSSCPDWRWKYNYSYPPLLSDLLKHIPYFDTTFIKQNDRNQFIRCSIKLRSTQRQFVSSTI